jgi:hypothetical protein
VCTPSLLLLKHSSSSAARAMIHQKDDRIHAYKRLYKTQKNPDNVEVFDEFNESVIV